MQSLAPEILCVTQDPAPRFKSNLLFFYCVSPLPREKKKVEHEKSWHTHTLWIKWAGAWERQNPLYLCLNYFLIYFSLLVIYFSISCALIAHHKVFFFISSILRTTAWTWKFWNNLAIFVSFSQKRQLQSKSINFLFYSQACNSFEWHSDTVHKKPVYMPGKGMVSVRWPL